MRIYKDFDDFLSDKFAKSEGNYILDDDWPEAFDEWVADLDPNELIKWADEYTKSKLANSHDELVEALKAVKRQLELAINALPLEKLSANMSEAISVASLALAKAEGK